MSHKIMIPLLNDEVAPRFDLATDVLLAKIKSNGEISERIIVLPQSSADDLCALATSDHTDAVVCGGIDDEHYQYLKWKGIEVLDDVIGPVQKAIQAYKDGKLSCGDNLYTL
ncbi:dinitrogenase iron-molybdenum cofactor biosynthesis protein [Desulfovibrio sp. JC022]|uniref:NifB/NifX family molybdenum-iron cluster-binding protein n=1 Tax=Desulfovibrio sp. JC022 TaxID=2593642 RepID=UPI0013D41CF7|nr:dinitrogenase iron-molybdenum cofactor biosynthesis protein [Desulfovibrio sp. JC022]NDV22330.1 dinitrogenase iron-molybdenum cofactor biosynthesis protein [Desulfovibrio sp. JC022]